MMRVAVQALAVLFLFWPGTAVAAQQAVWRRLQPGVEYARFDFPNPLQIGESLIHVVRLDPRVATFRAILASERGAVRRTAREWCEREGLAVAINMGMFRTDGITNVGYLRSGDRANNSRWNDYRAVLCLHPRTSDGAVASWIDRGPGEVLKPRTDTYDLVVQNLRLIRAPGKNCWSPSPRKWSEAAIAMDTDGRLLFLFVRCPLSMDVFNRALLALPLRVVKAMHVEGGPEASLSIHTNGLDLDLCGSYETGFLEDDSNRTQWPIPNVLGVKRAP